MPIKNRTKHNDAATVDEDRKAREARGKRLTVIAMLLGFKAIEAIIRFMKGLCSGSAHLHRNALDCLLSSSKAVL
ncbi:hypothetical protein AVEN_222959-1 [Araneus ventricosus]|uniref:Uncharacterized protein n=1 Tax=Araneus ventricosus TaxID=182803 RepID=A0A4Y2SDH4_ARAVE|nr:hypothetical protein AVEN_222959-1 [Araneus ventricosus]